MRTEKEEEEGETTEGRKQGLQIISDMLRHVKSQVRLKVKHLIFEISSNKLRQHRKLFPGMLKSDGTRLGNTCCCHGL